MNQERRKAGKKHSARRRLRLVRRRLHEFDRGAVGIAHIDDTLPGVRAALQGLRVACCFPTRGSDPLQNGVEVIDHEGDVDRPDVAGSRTKMLPLERRQVFEQLDFVPITFQHRDGNFRAGNAGDFTRQRASLVRLMRKLEAEDVAPEGERPLEVCNRDASVIGSDDLKGLECSRR